VNEIIPAATPTPGPAGYRNLTVPITDMQTVNNSRFGYSFGVCLNNNARFYAARIVYTYVTAGD
jgi:hypothetical protein